MCIVQDYLDLTKKYKAEYGEQTLLLMEVGSFFEVYALIKPDGDYNGTNVMGTTSVAGSSANAVVANAVVASAAGSNAVASTYIGSNIADFSKINDLVIAKKSTCVGKLQVVMAGFGTAFVDKYIQKMQDQGYTIVIYRQDVNDKTKRNLSEIISPGTFFPENDINLTNIAMCIWLHKAKATKHMPCQIVIGIANIDIYTGKTSLFQFQTEYNHSPATYDELERYISAYRPSECLFVANLPERLIDDIIGFTGLEETKIHKVAIEPGKQEPKVQTQEPKVQTQEPKVQTQEPGTQEPKVNMTTFAQNAEKQVYQVEVFKRFFPHLSSFPEMLPTHYVAIQAFCFLLDFVYQHSPNLTKKLTEPVFENYSDRLILSNHSLSQLNIVDDARHKGKYRSVSALLNNCVTTMGQRQFMYHLHYPSTQPVELQASYDITEHLLKKGEPYFLNIRQKINTIMDLEKFSRKVVLHKIMPKNLTALADDLQAIESLYEELLNDDVLQAYLLDSADIASSCREIITDLQRVFNLDICRNLSELDESQCINRGISLTLDTLLKNSMDGGDKLVAICNYLSSLIQQSEKKTATKAAMYVKIHETAKSHATLVCTSRRALLLKAALKKLPKNILLTYESNYSQTQETFDLDIQALECIVHGNSKSEMVITSTQIREITSNNEENQTKLVKEMNLVFQNYITDFAKFDDHLSSIIHYVMEMDLLQCKAYTAHKYNYCKPVIQNALNEAGKNKKSFFNFTGIRHPLIEHLQTNELYVTNDLKLAGASEAGASEAAQGILLYGTNAVGKTSFIKSVGIAVIMAQAGLYVPCNTFTYQPYRNVFTRILGNDNLFKGLSTFAVEMTELRTILTMADAHSLVLGDELCSGTESDSALSIFTAGLEILHKRESTFLFATHFHEINKYEEITNLTRLKMMHMAVHYNKEKNLLVYDRKLREGPGESMYGLEVCKSLNLPEDFLQRAHDIRMKYNPEKQNMLALSPTHFNAKKLVGNCELCKKHKASEVHHLQHQKNASSSNEYILNTDGQNFHKNHVANLLNICEGCHKKIHKTKEQHKVMKTSEGYILAKI
jgi:DNA mismatch repair protein MutS